MGSPKMADSPEPADAVIVPCASQLHALRQRKKQWRFSQHIYAYLISTSDAHICLLCIYI